MPVAPQAPVLAKGFFPLFNAKTAPASTRGAAELWARAYLNYMIAGGIPGAPGRESQLVEDFEVAFNPDGSGGDELFVKAMQTLWVGLPVPEQLAIAVSFSPKNLDLSVSLPDDVSQQDQSSSLAQVIGKLTLGSVLVQLTSPPNTILPLL